mmetsp:Transcript_11674/g.25484  ORF Transcript_11674/g.25484 Transcript_11674/m.25484 type:complete len:239 (-) Transcript_11674:79-795(-)
MIRRWAVTALMAASAEKRSYFIKYAMMAVFVRPNPPWQCTTTPRLASSAVRINAMIRSSCVKQGGVLSATSKWCRQTPRALAAEWQAGSSGGSWRGMTQRTPRAAMAAICAAVVGRAQPAKRYPFVEEVEAEVEADAEVCTLSLTQLKLRGRRCRDSTPISSSRANTLSLPSSHASVPLNRAVLISRKSANVFPRWASACKTTGSLACRSVTSKRGFCTAFQRRMCFKPTGRPSLSSA